MATAINLLIFLTGSLTFKVLTNAQTAELFTTTDECVCGKPGPLIERVTYGKEVKPHTYPWMTALLRNRGLHCGGTLINDRYILTAAHCLNRNVWGDLKVYLGIHEIMHAIRGNVRSRKIASIRPHKNYRIGKLSPDIGLIKLRKPVNFTDKISPICLPKIENDYASRAGAVAGWGRLKEGGYLPRKLQHANVTVIKNQDCKKLSPVLKKLVNDWMVCAYGGKQDSCDGDSGGPLQAQRKLKNGTWGCWEELGVISWGIGCGRHGLPGVYARVPKLIKWIAKFTKDAIYCTSPD